MWQKEIAQTLQLLGDTYTAEIETNGTIEIEDMLRNRRNIDFNVSVKLSSSTQEAAYEDKRINKKALLSFPRMSSVYKFVITEPSKDLKEIKEILQIRELPVYVMPEGLTRDDVLKNSIDVIEIAIQNNFRFTPREHVNVWNTKKGV